jgi:hypothetical protein
MTAVVPEPPRQGQYLPTETYTETEGGGALVVRARVCDTCVGALIDEAQMDAHMSRHEAEAAGEGPGGPSGPKSGR